MSGPSAESGAHPVERLHGDGTPRRYADCAALNPWNDETHQACCRFPKTCSPYPFDEAPITDADLEPLHPKASMPSAEKDAGHGAMCSGCLVLGFVARLEKAEAQIDALMTALHLTMVGVEPTSKWLDARMAAIEATYPTPPAGGDA